MREKTSIGPESPWPEGPLQYSPTATDGDTMQEAYPGKDLEAMAFARRYHRWIRDRFHPHLGGRIGEVGAGMGDFTALLLETGVHSLVAWEPSGNLYPALARRFDGDRRVAVIHDRFTPPDGPPLDTLCYINVLEHIADDEAELVKARRALHPEGRLCLFVPALPRLYSEQDRSVGHFRRYRRRDLQDKVQRAGFTIRETRWFDIAGILPWWFAYRVLRRRVSPGAVDGYDRWVVPVMRRVESMIPPPIGKNLLMVASPGAPDR